MQKRAACDKEAGRKAGAKVKLLGEGMDRLDGPTTKMQRNELLKKRKKKSDDRSPRKGAPEAEKNNNNKKTKEGDVWR
jgi:hypothetical protein